MTNWFLIGSGIKKGERLQWRYANAALPNRNEPEQVLLKRAPPEIPRLLSLKMIHLKRKHLFIFQPSRLYGLQVIDLKLEIMTTVGVLLSKENGFLAFWGGPMNDGCVPMQIRKPLLYGFTMRWFVMGVLQLHNPPLHSMIRPKWPHYFRLVTIWNILHPEVFTLKTFSLKRCPLLLFGAALLSVPFFILFPLHFAREFPSPFQDFSKGSSSGKPWQWKPNSGC